jgi:phenylalanyl-tRNA synthetase alpha chain
MAARLIGRQVSNITDTTQIELREVESSGTLAAGEKALSELRKRKLIIQRFHLFLQRYY